MTGICVTTAAAATPYRTRTTRPHLNAATQERHHGEATRPDTLAANVGDVEISGYDKPLRSNRESAFFTNHTSQRVKAIIITITYLDSRKRTLHTRRVRLTTDIPPGETRQAYWRSWDLQNTFYYHLSQRPRSASAASYTITCRVDSLACTSN